MPTASEVGNGRSESHGLGNGGRPRLELPRQFIGREPVAAHVGDHSAARRGRGAWRPTDPAWPQDPDPCRPEHLVGTEDQEVAAECPDVGRKVGNRLAPSASTSAPARWAASAMRAKGGIVPRTFGHRGAGDELHPVEQAIEVRQVQPVVVRPWGSSGSSNAALLSQHQPWNQVGVVLHVGQQD